MYADRNGDVVLTCRTCCAKLMCRLMSWSGCNVKFSQPLLRVVAGALPMQGQPDSGFSEVVCNEHARHANESCCIDVCTHII